MKKVLILVISLIASIFSFCQNYDSIKKAREVYAWGDIKFGDKCTGKSDTEFIYDEKFYTIEHCINEKIVSIELESETQNFESYGHILTKMATLCDAIKDMYGPADKTIEYPIDWYKLDAEKNYIYKFWEMGNKCIAVSIYRDGHNNFSTSCVFIDTYLSNMRPVSKQVSKF